MRMKPETAITILETMGMTYGLFVANPDEYKDSADMGVVALGKQIPKPPKPDENTIGRDGKPVPRCQVCGYAMDLQIEQYCPNCGQRLTEYEETK